MKPYSAGSFVQSSGKGNVPIMKQSFKNVFAVLMAFAMLMAATSGSFLYSVNAEEAEQETEETEELQEETEELEEAEEPDEPEELMITFTDAVSDKNALTFFQWLSARTDQSQAVRDSAATAARLLQNQMTPADMAAGILNDGTVSGGSVRRQYSEIISYTSDHIGAEGSATSWENFKYALQQLQLGNTYRAKENIAPLNVSSVMMAEAEINANYQSSLSTIDHASAFLSLENLAYSWSSQGAGQEASLGIGKRNPYDGWYDMEKSVYDYIIAKGWDYSNLTMEQKLEIQNALGLRNISQVLVGHYLTLTDRNGVQSKTGGYGYISSVTTDGSYTVFTEKQSHVFGFSRSYAGGEDGIPVAAYLNLVAEFENGTPAPDPTPDPEPTDDPSGTTVKMYRMYNPNSGEHFYTGNAKEKEMLVNTGWKAEGVGFTAPKKSNTPMYRLYNENAGDHHYTSNAKERDHLISIGWKDEGIGWYADDAKGVAMYRLYNPNCIGAGSHHYTSNAQEKNHLTSIGWKDEGVGFYAVKESGEPTPAPTIAPTPVPTMEPTPTPSVVDAPYIGNSNTKKFHLASCKHVKDIANEHMVGFNDRESAVSQGYIPCKTCNP